MPETYLSPSSSAAETEDGQLICELRDVQRKGSERWKLVSAPYDILSRAEDEDAFMDDGSILVQAFGSNPPWNEIADIAELVEETQLSERQAEFYAWNVKAGLTIKASASEMGISEGNAREKRSAVRRKIREAQEDKTRELEISKGVQQ